MPLTTAEIKANISKFDRQARPAYLDMFEIRRKAILSKFGPALQTLPSDGPSEKYPLIKATPSLVEYDEGNVPVSSIGDGGPYELANKKFGMSVAIGQDFFSDLDRMPAAKAQYLAQIAGLGVRAANKPIQLVADLLLKEGNYASFNAWDGFPITSLSHLEGANLHASNDTYSIVKIGSDHDTALDLFTAQVDPDGHDKLREEAPSDLLVVTDPQHLRVYAEFFKAQMITDITGVAAAISNILSPANAEVARGVDGLGNGVTLVGWSRLRGKKKTFYFDLSNELPGLKPLVWQERMAPKLTMLGDGTEVGEIAEQIWWKVKMRGNVGIGDYNKIVEINKTAGS
jgi:phage major head subunit gpT-like protein